MNTPSKYSVAPILAAASLVSTPALGKPEEPSPDQLLSQCRDSLTGVEMEIGALLTALRTDSRKFRAHLKGKSDALDVSAFGASDQRDLSSSAAESFELCVSQAQRTQTAGANPDLDLTACFGRMNDRVGLSLPVRSLSTGDSLDMLDSCSDDLENALGRRDKVLNWIRIINYKTQRALKERTDDASHEEAARDGLVREKAARLRALQNRSRR